MNSDFIQNTYPYNYNGHLARIGFFSIPWGRNLVSSHSLFSLSLYPYITGACFVLIILYSLYLEYDGA